MNLRSKSANILIVWMIDLDKDNTLYPNILREIRDFTKFYTTTIKQSNLIFH